MVISTKNVLARVHKKFQRGQHSEIYLLTLKERDKTKMELPLGMVSKHYGRLVLQNVENTSKRGP